ncbi:Type 1 glutamine amidotransferase-like domain-containing protein [Metabacillus herbersteinensis]|uniref:Type 1 glutamine amidotransferase-like domain-containing protein n=1 Tax=Metabacillus herbersteinensis TaxID=283816 RepID=A0ABV6GJ24_9BACI
MRLALIGGGFVKHTDNFHINKRIVELVEKTNPKVLFIPTASNDNEDYITEFTEIFEKQLECHVNVLRCINNNPSEAEIKKMINSADLIYLGGGNYINMMEKWKEYKINQRLVEALQNDTLIAGISAGAICWFKCGIRTNYEGEGYIESPGWNMINKIFCPHYNQMDRANEFHRLLLQNGNENEHAIALEDNCALYLTNDTYEIIGEPSKAWEFQVIENELLKQKFIERAKTSI